MKLRECLKQVVANRSTGGYFLLVALMVASVAGVVTTSLFGNNVFIVLYGLIGILAIILCVLTLKQRFFSHEFHDYLLLGLLLWSVVSTAFAENSNISFFGTDYRNDGLYSYLIYAAIYILARSISNSDRKRELLKYFCYMVSVMSLMTLTQKVFCVPGISKVSALYASSLSNINHFAYLLCMAVVASAGLVFVEVNTKWKAIFTLMSAFCMWALIVNNTFGSYIATLFGIAFVSLVMVVRDTGKWREAVAVVTVILAVNIASNIGNNAIANNIESSFDGVEVLSDSIEITEQAGSGRIELWRQAVEYIKERPILGFGPEGLAKRYYEDGYSNDRPHNEYLQYAVFLGIPGLIMYLAALIGIAVKRFRSLKKQDYIVIVVGATILTYCISACFGNTMFYTSVYYFMLLGLL